MIDVTNVSIPGINHEEVGGERVEDNIEEMVGSWVSPRDGVVEPECGGGEGAEGLVGAAVRERRAPEVVDQQVGEGGARAEVVVLEYRPPGKENDQISELVECFVRICLFYDCMSMLASRKIYFVSFVPCFPSIHQAQ